MKTLGSPAGIAVIALLLTAAAHPSVDFGGMGALAPLVVPLLALLLALAAGLAVRGARPDDLLVAAGIAVVISAVAYDAVRGRSGQVTLRPDEGTQTFEESGPGGTAIGLRPLGFDLKLSHVAPADATLAIAAPAHASSSRALVPGKPVVESGLRLGWVEYDDWPRVAVRLTRLGEQLDFELVGRTPVTLEGATIQLQRSLPDFAIDARNVPYSRSAEFRNPGALLQVRRGRHTWPVFVLQSIAGAQQFNQVPELGWTFNLTSMAAEPPRLTLGVHREPAAWGAALGTAFILVGFALGLRR